MVETSGEALFERFVGSFFSPLLPSHVSTYICWYFKTLEKIPSWRDLQDLDFCCCSSSLLFLSFLIQSFFVFSWQFFNKKNFQVGEIFGTLIFAPLLSSSRVQYLMEPLLYIHTVDSTHTHILSFQDDHDHEGVDNDQDPQKTAD